VTYNGTSAASGRRPAVTRPNAWSAAGPPIPRLDELLAQTRALGARHVGYGVRAADYRTVGVALLDALAAVLGDDFDAPTREAWATAYNLMAETMLDGAASARPIGS
jgi:hemoglobin-like flavoprotein